MLDAIRQRNERRKALEALVADGKRWYFYNPDDDACMNIYVVSTNPVEPDYTEIVQQAGDPSDGDIVAVTLLQSPRIRFSREHNLDALSQLIAEEHNQPASADIDQLLALAPLPPSPKQRMIRHSAQLTISLLAGIASGFVALEFDVSIWLMVVVAAVGQWLIWKMAHYTEGV